MVGTVIGLPAATLISQSSGWRISFWAVAVLALVAGLITLWTVPASPKPAAVSLRAELTVFRNGRLWAAFATSMLIIGATFAAMGRRGARRARFLTLVPDLAQSSARVRARVRVPVEVGT